MFKEEVFYVLITIYLRTFNNSKTVKKEKDILNGSLIVVTNSLKLSNLHIKCVNYITNHVDKLRNLVQKTNFQRLENGKSS